MEEGKTLLVDGPTSVTLLSGRVEILGAKLKAGAKIVIREGKRTPFEIKQTAQFDLMLGEGGNVSEVDASTIPASWENAVKAILEEAKPTLMVLGGIDSGKTSFCAYLANKALSNKRHAVIVDADLGQSDIGPPATIGSSRVVKPIKDPFDMRAENVCFIGVTSPNSAVNKIIDGINELKVKGLNNGADLLIINTDGWIEGEDAVRYKLELINRVRPGILAGIQEQNELAPILERLKEPEPKILELVSSTAMRKRDREERKLLRELGYKKFLKGANMQSFSLGWTRITGIPIGLGTGPSEARIEKIGRQLGVSPIYCEETANFLFIVLSKGGWTDEEIVKGLEESLNKEVKVVWEGDEKGLLVALCDNDERVLGIGVLQEIDYERRIIKVYTPVRNDVASIHVGQIKIDRTGKEQGSSEAFSRIARDL